LKRKLVLVFSNEEKKGGRGGEGGQGRRKKKLHIK